MCIRKNEVYAMGSFYIKILKIFGHKTSVGNDPYKNR